ncbi:putative deoxyribonuclease gamma [Scophthalmus maximus]|uniref:Putative deoxyribonuclease gamma n=1 Tax=Scophthalmus maximus TaxID=52904 RepID=A0A2U9C3F4_SCOMX|nr:putative deoxyribonuclease gamma [Scophthalmus maximus]
MDTLAGIQLSPGKDLDQIAEVRAERRENLRGRNNASIWSEQVTLMRQEKDHSRKQTSTSTTMTKDSNQQRMKRENSINAQKTSIKTVIQTENFQRTFSHQTENILQKKKLRDAGVQTVSGLVTVKESDVQRLAEYLQEALWREEVVKQKLAALQESTSSLMNSSNKIWTARCSEDLLRNKIKALEAQLQVCLQKFPKDGVRKLVVQMEKQKLIYEEKALVALQRATQEKTEALSKAETLQEVQITAQAEAVKWQSLYEELKLSTGQLRETQHLSNERLQQLHSQVELSRSREAELREDVLSLRRENKELRSNICLLAEDNHILREEIQRVRDGCKESQSFEMQDVLTSEEAEPQVTLRRDSEMEEQLRHTQEKLQLKDRECEELQTELHALEQECQSSQARLSQCRDELRQLSHRRRTLEEGDLAKLSFTDGLIILCRMRTEVLLLVAGLCVLNVTSSLKICAFNIQSFGEAKANNQKVMAILLKILSRCDLCLIQEVRDSKGEAIQTLVKDLNRFDKSNSYSYVESERLGRKTYKEQYVYIYRDNVLKVKELYQYPRVDEGTNETDVFSREPFIIRFHSPTTLVKDFVLIGQHTSPKTAMKEIDELYTVFKGIYRKWKNDNVMILGDLNAGCSYVTIKGWRAVRLRSDPRFRWLIGDEQDTTVRKRTHCAYDRIIVHGREIISSVVPGSAQPFNFKESFHLTEQEALEVSDHFPVEVDLKPNHRYLLRHEL